MAHHMLGLGDIHRLANWEYATATARNAATGFVAHDIGKIAKQTDNNTFWELTAVTPAWLQIGGGSNIQLDITINAQDGNEIEIDIQVQDSSGNNLSAIYGFDVWLTDDVDGVLATTPPDGGLNIYAPGLEVFSYVTDLAKKVITDDSGQITIVVDESSTATWYLCIQMPDGTITISDAITFA